MMKTSDLGLAIAFLAATGLIVTHAAATEKYVEQRVAIGRENNTSDDRGPSMQQQRAKVVPACIAEDGADRLIERRVAQAGKTYDLESNANTHLAMD